MRNKIGWLFVLLLLFIPNSSNSQIVNKELPKSRLKQCNANAKNKLVLINNGGSNTDCNVDDDNGSYTVQCKCSNINGDDEWGWVALVDVTTMTSAISGISIPDPPSSATTSTEGLVTLADNGESSSTDVVVGNDVRLSQRPRSVRVDSEANEVAGRVYNTVEAAVAYVATQNPVADATWKVNVVSDSLIFVQPFTIPDHTQLNCTGGGSGNIYDSSFGTGTRIISAGGIETGTFITFGAKASMQNCVVVLTGVGTGPRNVVSCPNGCYIDHSSIHLSTGSANTNSDVVLNLSGTYTTNRLYYVLVSAGGYNNANLVGIKVNDTAYLTTDNTTIADGGASVGKALQIASASPSYVAIHNTTLGSIYNASNWAVDISNESTATVHIVRSRWKTKSGTLTDWNRGGPPQLVSPPYSCSSDVGGHEYFDTSGADCVCDGVSTWTKRVGAGTCA